MRHLAETMATGPVWWNDTREGCPRSRCLEACVTGQSCQAGDYCQLGRRYCLSFKQATRCTATQNVTSKLNVRVVLVRSFYETVNVCSRKVPLARIVAYGKSEHVGWWIKWRHPNQRQWRLPLPRQMNPDWKGTRRQGTSIQSDNNLPRS